MQFSTHLKPPIPAFDPRYDRPFSLNLLLATPSLLATDKPFDARIDGETHSAPTIESLLQLEYPTPKLFLIHQLDYATSGVMLWGRNKEITACIGKKFQLRQVKKTYLALVNGWVEQNEFTISKPIAPHPHEPRTCMAIGTDENPGRPAETRVTVLKRGYYLGSSLETTLVKLEPVSGRRHQLRLHMQSIGHAIIGDFRYEVPFSESFRMMLHAWRLVVPGVPETVLKSGCVEEGEMVDLEFEAPCRFEEWVLPEQTEGHLLITYDFERMCDRKGENDAEQDSR